MKALRETTGYSPHHSKACTVGTIVEEPDGGIRYVIESYTYSKGAGFTYIFRGGSCEHASVVDGEWVWVNDPRDGLSKWRYESDLRQCI